MHDFHSRLCSIELLTEIMRVCLLVWRMKLLFLINQPPTMSPLIGSCICEIKELSSRSVLYKHWSPRYKQQSVAGTLHSVSGFLSPDPQLLRGKRETPDKLLVTNVNWVLPSLNTQHFYLIMFTPESGVVTGWNNISSFWVLWHIEDERCNTSKSHRDIANSISLPAII